MAQGANLQNINKWHVCAELSHAVTVQYALIAGRHDQTILVLCNYASLAEHCHTSSKNVYSTACIIA